MSTDFECEKQPAIGSRGTVVTNHPLASAAGAEILATGGNAVDAAVGALFTLTVVEPMMIGILGGGLMHIRTPEGRHTILDGLATAPAAAHADMYEPLEREPFAFTDVAHRRNSIGADAVAVPGNLAAWCKAVERFGRMSLADLAEAAIRHARRGFAVTPYLHAAIKLAAADIARDAPLARRLLPDGSPLPAGARLVQGDVAESLDVITREGAAALYQGTLGKHVTECISAQGGRVTREDLQRYTLMERAVIRGRYRGFEICGPPPPASSGVHITQMLNILEGFDVRGLGFGSAAGMHLIAEVQKIAFADRASVTADPAFVHVPIERLISREYAMERRRDLDTERSRSWSATVVPNESPNTTHVTTADREGYVVSATHTLNSLFGARFLIPELGLIPNDYMWNLDPRPGRASSIAPGKRVTSSQAPMILLKEGRPVYALGLPGGLRIFGCAMQTIVNLIDHGMSLQEAVEAPRLWTQGHDVEIEPAFPDTVCSALEKRGHSLLKVPHVGGGMNAVAFGLEGRIEGAACWRADGVPIGVGGGLARAGVQFWPDRPRHQLPKPGGPHGVTASPVSEYGDRVPKTSR